MLYLFKIMASNYVGNIANVKCDRHMSKELHNFQLVGVL